MREESNGGGGGGGGGLKMDGDFGRRKEGRLERVKRG